MGVEARKEPAEHDELAPKYIGISLEGSMEIGIECLARGYAAAVGREDHGLPRREHRERVPHEGEAREGSDQVREEHREERVVLDEEPNSRDRGFRSAISPHPPRSRRRPASVWFAAVRLSSRRPSTCTEGARCSARIRFRVSSAKSRMRAEAPSRVSIPPYFR